MSDFDIGYFVGTFSVWAVCFGVMFMLIRVIRRTDKRASKIAAVVLLFLLAFGMLGSLAKKASAYDERAVKGFQDGCTSSYIESLLSQGYGQEFVTEYSTRLCECVASNIPDTLWEQMEAVDGPANLSEAGKLEFQAIGQSCAVVVQDM